MRRSEVVGKMFSVILPYSEVCMYMRVAGTRMVVEVIETPGKYLMAQLRHLSDLRPFSAPITPGEAGVIQEFDGEIFFHSSSEVEPLQEVPSE